MARLIGFDLDAISRSRSGEYPTCLLRNDGADELSKAIECMKRYPEKGRSILKHWVLAERIAPPLEFIWKLNEEEVMFVTTYFYVVPNSLDVLYETLNLVYSTVGTSSEKSSACSVLASIIATIVNTLMNPSEEVQTFFKDATKRIILSGVKLLDEGAMQGCFLTDVLNSVHIFQSCLQNFLQLILKQLLSYPQPEIESAAVIGFHAKKWTTKHLSVGTVHFISKILSSLPIEVIITEIRSATNLPPLKWKYLLAILSVLVIEHGSSFQSIKSLIDDWLRVGLEENNKDSLYIAFIAARHCCAEKTKAFPNYINWFGSAQPSNPQHFTIFFNFLTELVPYEPPLYLKIHVNKVPTAPPGCQNVLTDYITLAKTRLTDLNLTTDYLSIFNECYDTDEESLSADVSQLLKHFKSTNEIAKPVLEASVFRKQYYEKVFLKHLLKVPAKDDPLREMVIKKLHSLGKISPAMFTSWASLV